MVFGTSLRVPGQFFHPSPMNQWPEPGCYANRLSLHMSRLHPVPTRLANKPVFVPSDLRSCSHVFFRHDAIRPPLQPVYDGPFRVVNRGEKNFTFIKGGKEDTVSIDRLKLDFLDSGESVSPKFPATSVPLETAQAADCHLLPPGYRYQTCLTHIVPHEVADVSNSQITFKRHSRFASQFFPGWDGG